LPLRGYFFIGLLIVIGIVYSILAAKYKKNIILWFFYGIASFLVPVASCGTFYDHYLRVFFKGFIKFNVYMNLSLLLAIGISVMVFLWLRVKLKKEKFERRDLIKEIGEE